jgi:outer membrane protein OmpA-like peptidoglycan-associated protein
MLNKAILPIALALLCGCAQSPSEHPRANDNRDKTAKASSAEHVQAPATVGASRWWPFTSTSASQLPKSPSPSPSSLTVHAEQDRLTQVWLDRYEAPLRTALEGSGFTLERRHDVLMVSIPVQGSFNPDRPQMLMPAKLGPLARIAKLRVADTQAPAVLILGHSDSRGQIEPNRRLSQQRAQAVAGIFTLSGFKPDRLLIKGVGSDMPRAANDSSAGRTLNRRVNVLLAPAETLLALLERYSKPTPGAQIATEKAR